MKEGVFMNCKISGKQINLGESLTNYATNSIKEAVQKFYGREAEISVTISKENNVYETDISIHLTKGIIINAHGEDLDPYAAVDFAVKRVVKQLQRNKDMKNSKRNKISEFLIHTNNLDDFDSEKNYEDESSDEPIVIAEIKENLTNMTLQEAIKKLSNSTEDIVIFKTGTKVNVVFWRKDGNIGWVES